jgi:hypothetical protein
LNGATVATGNENDYSASTAHKNGTKQQMY